MIKKQLLVLFLSLFACSVSMAKTVKSQHKAVSMVTKSVQENNLTSLKLDCLIFMISDENEQSYIVDVREYHDEKCGGNPDTAPRLMSYEVNKETGKMCTDSIRWAEYLKVSDPYDFQCRAIK